MRTPPQKSWFLPRLIERLDILSITYLLFFIRNLKSGMAYTALNRLAENTKILYRNKKSI